MKNKNMFDPTKVKSVAFVYGPKPVVYGPRPDAKKAMQSIPIEPIDLDELKNEPIDPEAEAFLDGVIDVGRIDNGKDGK